MVQLRPSAALEAGRELLGQLQWWRLNACYNNSPTRRCPRCPYVREIINTIANECLTSCKEINITVPASNKFGPPSMQGYLLKHNRDDRKSNLVVSKAHIEAAHHRQNPAVAVSCSSGSQKPQAHLLLPLVQGAKYKRRWVELTPSTLVYAASQQDVHTGRIQVYSVSDLILVRPEGDNKLLVSDVYV